MNTMKRSTELLALGVIATIALACADTPPVPIQENSQAPQDAVRVIQDILGSDLALNSAATGLNRALGRPIDAPVDLVEVREFRGPITRPSDPTPVAMFAASFQDPEDEDEGQDNRCVIWEPATEEEIEEFMACWKRLRDDPECDAMPGLLWGTHGDSGLFALVGARVYCVEEQD